MNAIIISAVWGVVMMFSGIFLQRTAAIRNVAVAGLIVLLAMNIAELYELRLFTFDVHNMLIFNSFTLVFNTIAIGSTLVYFFFPAQIFKRQVQTWRNTLH